MMKKTLLTRKERTMNQTTDDPRTMLQPTERVTILASYCLDEDCTDDVPCRDCLLKCSQFDLLQSVYVDPAGLVGDAFEEATK